MSYVRRWTLNMWYLVQTLINKKPKYLTAEDLDSIISLLLNILSIVLKG